ncbi:CoA pyrophosphatase [Pseudomonadota bacterium]|jgi:8-oxo-dGTP pyrophosphatase MutT (NUDIX family)|nr:CoA pyrophosphatase [Gammaproteobacteria bacterium]MDA9603392.1 CoA pyrophosphatase [bacterium]MDA9626823.1 CoA pyrophosphatase [Pseudomonadota bacterium]MDA9675725.1 CoA pyrophosphatase [Pseudomonadota bacterium]MDA9685083.1 CoA pyrophosphatase [Pseudomonadota bacterium]|tara:strand:+ start:922 stop:1500 length:579 start_codon:yes stop_codon:yes gene_type:complete
MIEEIKYKLNSSNSEKPSGRPQASVLIAILNYGEYIESPELIYTQRSGHLSTHSGEVSFPGGKAEDGDVSLFDTALRESNEEMSLNGEDVTMLGKLDYLISRHKIEVNPFIATVDKPQDLEANEEIQEIFTVPLSFLLDPKNIKRESIERQGSVWEVPTWSLKNQKIWGLTAMITVNFLNVCFDANIEILEG